MGFVHIGGARARPWAHVHGYAGVTTNIYIYIYILVLTSRFKSTELSFQPVGHGAPCLYVHHASLRSFLSYFLKGFGAVFVARAYFWLLWAPSVMQDILFHVFCDFWWAPLELQGMSKRVPRSSKMTKMTFKVIPSVGLEAMFVACEQHLEVR